MHVNDFADTMLIVVQINLILYSDFILAYVLSLSPPPPHLA